MTRSVQRFARAQLVLTRAPRQHALQLHERGLLLARQGWLFSVASSADLEALADRTLRTLLRAPRTALELPWPHARAASAIASRSRWRFPPFSERRYSWTRLKRRKYWAGPG